MQINNKDSLKKNLHQLPCIPVDEITLLYDNDYWDGPLEGLCLWKNKKYYFLWCGETNEEGEITDRKFLIIDLTAEQLKIEEKTHESFIKLIGDHYTYVKGKRKENPQIQGKDSQEEFYRTYKNIPSESIDPKQLIGWFKIS